MIRRKCRQIVRGLEVERFGETNIHPGRQFYC
jgi:hypothetical protein